MQGQLTIANPEVGHFDADSVVSKIGGLMNRVFGCWHTEMSRPFSHQGQAYRMCVNCGARRQFNLGKWEMQGSYYYNPATTSSFQNYRLAAVRKV
jgi:hypothetical protein